MKEVKNLEMPSRINSIKTLAYPYKNTNKFIYVLNENEREETAIKVEEHIEKGYQEEEKYRKRRCEIVDESRNFKKGYKVVQMASREYAYLEKKSGLLLKEPYDIATDFNKYGFAMVAKAGNVTWINQEFKFLDLWGRWIEGEINRNTFGF